VEIATGSPGNMLSFEEVESKFRDCLKQGNRHIADPDAVVTFVQDLENVADVRELLSLLVWKS
jgi:hypothetical protein